MLVLLMYMRFQYSPLLDSYSEVRCIRMQSSRSIIDNFLWTLV